MPNDLKTPPAAVQILLGILLFAASLGTGWHAFQLLGKGNQFSSMETAGLALIFMGGSLNPINFLWLCLPFTRNDIAATPKSAMLGWIIGGIGFIPFVIGMIGRHVTN